MDGVAARGVCVWRGTGRDRLIITLNPHLFSAAPLPPDDAASLNALVSSANASLDALHLSIKHVTLPAVDGDADEDDDAPSTPSRGAWALVNADPEAAARAHGAAWGPGVGAFLKAVLSAAAATGGVAGVVDQAAALAVAADDAPPQAAEAAAPVAAAAASPGGGRDGSATPTPARAPTHARPKPLPLAARRDAISAFVSGGWLRRVRGGAALAIGPRSFLELGGVLAHAPGVRPRVVAEWRAMGVVIEDGAVGEESEMEMSE